MASSKLELSLNDTEDSLFEDPIVRRKVRRPTSPTAKRMKLSQSEDTKSSQSENLTCLLCNKTSDDKIANVIHMKQCAKKRKVALGDLQQAFEKNEKLPKIQKSKKVKESVTTKNHLALATAISLSLTESAGKTVDAVDKNVYDSQKATLEAFGFTSSSASSATMPFDFYYADEMSVFVEFVQSEKGKPLLLCDGHLFYNDKVLADRKYWFCREKYKTTCGVRAITKGNQLVKQTREHNHLPDPKAIASAKNYELRKLVANTCTRNSLKVLIDKRQQKQAKRKKIHTVSILKSRTEDERIRLISEKSATVLLNNVSPEAKIKVENDLPRLWCMAGTMERPEDEESQTQPGPEPQTSYNEPPLKFEYNSNESHVDSLSEDWDKLVGNSKWSDACIMASDGPVPIHKIVLQVRCPYLDLEFLLKFKLKITSSALLAMLRYLYAGKLDPIEESMMEEAKFLASRLFRRTDLANLLSEKSQNGSMPIPRSHLAMINHNNDDEPDTVPVSPENEDELTTGTSGVWSGCFNSTMNNHNSRGCDDEYEKETEIAKIVEFEKKKKGEMADDLEDDEVDKREMEKIYNMSNNSVREQIITLSSDSEKNDDDSQGWNGINEFPEKIKVSPDHILSQSLLSSPRKTRKSNECAKILKQISPKSSPPENLETANKINWNMRFETSVINNESTEPQRSLTPEMDIEKTFCENRLELTPENVEAEPANSPEVHSTHCDNFYSKNLNPRMETSWLPETGRPSPSTSTPPFTNRNFIEISPNLTPSSKIVKSSTPVPDFQNMDQDNLKVWGKKYGLKSLPPTKARKILQHLYDEEHPIMNKKTGKFVNFL